MGIVEINGNKSSELKWNFIPSVCEKGLEDSLPFFYIQDQQVGMAGAQKNLKGCRAKQIAPPEYLKSFFCYRYCPYLRRISSEKVT